MTRVLLIRHGETEWNRDRRWQGHADPPLTPQGEYQADELARRLAASHPGLSRVYSSDLVRAADTARRVVRQLGCALHLDPLWREMDVGEWSGLRREEIERRFAEQWQRIVAGEDLPRGGGETFGAFTARIRAGLDRLPRLHPTEGVAVVTHGGVIRAALLDLLGLPFERLREIGAVANTAAAELSFGPSGWEIVRTASAPGVEPDPATSP